MATTLPRSAYAPLIIARARAQDDGQIWAVQVRLSEDGIRRLRDDGADADVFKIGEVVECYSGAATAERAREEYADLGAVVAVHPLTIG